MSIEQIKETDTLNQGRIKINSILDQSNAASEKVDTYQEQLATGIEDAKKIAEDAGKNAVSVAEQAGEQANATAEQALTNSQTAINTSNQAVSTANNNKQEFDALRNDFEKLVGEAGDSNPEIVQARTDTQGVTQPTLATRLQSDFADRMTKAEAISLLSGTESIKIVMDFQGKTAGNTSTNANQYFTDVTAKVLKKPNETWNEISQSDYNKLVSRDDSGVVSGSSQTGVIPQQLGAFDLLKAVGELIPQSFEGLSQEESVAFVKDNFIAFTISERVKAVSPNNKTIKISAYSEAADSWATQIQENVDEYKDVSVQVTDKNLITNEGLIYLISYTDPSNGVTTANLDVDYSAVQLEISINAQAVLAKSGFVKEEQLNSHTKNQENPHEVTATQVGLGNVKNYGFATDSEASAGTSTTKYMSPKNVAEAIDTQAVTQTNDQEISGIKNFEKPPQVNGVNVSTVANVKKYVYKQQGLYGLKASNFTDAECNFAVVRIGNTVTCMARIAVANTTGWGNNFKAILNLPSGFVGSNDTSQIWNIPCGITRFSYNATKSANSLAMYEPAKNELRMATDAAGNTYVVGTWITNDPFPKAGNLGNGTVTIFEQKENGSY